MLRWFLDGQPSRPTNFPTDTGSANGGGQRLTEALVNDRPPWHQRETHAIIQHGELAAGQLHRLPVLAGHAIAVANRAVVKAGGSLKACGRGFEFPFFELTQEVRREKQLRSLALRQPLAEELFLAGLLQDVGMLALDQALPELYRNGAALHSTVSARKRICRCVGARRKTSPGNWRCRV